MNFESAERKMRRLQERSEYARKLGMPLAKIMPDSVRKPSVTVQLTVAGDEAREENEQFCVEGIIPISLLGRFR